MADRRQSRVSGFTPAQRLILDDWRRWAPSICSGGPDNRFYADGWARRPTVDGLALAGGLALGDVLNAVAAESGVAARAILGPRRGRREARARQLAMHLMRTLCPERSLSAIAAFLERDHTTVLHGLKVAARLLDPADAAFDAVFAGRHARLRAMLGAASEGDAHGAAGVPAAQAGKLS